MGSDTTQPNPSSSSPDSDPRLLCAGALPRRIGKYHVKRLIASGGMGTVYEAIQENPHRVVALKIMKRGVTSKSAHRRFEYESQVLARLRHACIAQVYEAGVHEDVSGPLPYFAMEYIPNAKSITAYATARHLGVRQKLGLFGNVWDAVHHGHQKGIIHRDLKPGNILVDSGGEVKIIDFGVARSTDSDMAATTEQTAIGDLIGTLKYMSPEQCEGDPQDLDTRSDVYALGVVLYELLSGRLPYEMDHTPVYDVPRIIREAPATHLSAINRTLRGDLETIVEKALEKDRRRRYQSAESMREDIERFLRHQPILARPPSLGYKFRKFLFRRRVRIGVAAALVAAVSLAAERQLHSRRLAAEAAKNAAVRVYFEALELADRREEQKALAKATEAIALEPTMGTAFALRAKMEARLKDKAGARRDCKAAIRLEPDNSLAWRTLGSLELEAGNFEAAKRAYDRGIRVLVSEHDLPEDFHSRARLYQMAGDYEAALADRDRAIALLPDQGRLYQSRGITRYCTGDVDGSISDWIIAAERDHNSVIQCGLWTWEARMLRGDVGDVSGAKSALAAIQATAEVDSFARVIVQHFQGKSSVEDVMAEVKTVDDRCQALYYLAAAALVRGDANGSIELFDRCRQTGAHGRLEYDLAGCHLKKLR